MIGGERVLLEYLLAEGARVEATGRPILLRARLCGASEEIKELLVRYGARPVSKEEEEEEGLVGHQGGGSVLGGLWVTLLDLAERAGLRGYWGGKGGFRRCADGECDCSVIGQRGHLGLYNLCGFSDKNSSAGPAALARVTTTTVAPNLLQLLSGHIQ